MQAMAALKKIRSIDELPTNRRRVTPEVAVVARPENHQIGNFSVKISRAGNKEETAGILVGLADGPRIGNFVLADAVVLGEKNLEFRSYNNSKIFPCPERGHVALKELGLCLIGVVGNSAMHAPVLSTDRAPRHASAEISSEKFPIGVSWRGKLVRVQMSADREVSGSEILSSIDLNSYLNISDTQQISVTAQSLPWNTTLQYFSSPFPANASDLVEIYHPLKLHPLGNFTEEISDSVLRAASVPFLVLQLFRDERQVKLRVLAVLGELMSTDFHDRSDARLKYVHEVRLQGGGHAMIDIMQRASDAGDEKLYIEAARCLGHLIAQHREFLANAVSHNDLFALVLRASRLMRRVQSAVCNVHLLAAMLEVMENFVQKAARATVEQLLETFITYMESNIPAETVEIIVFALGKLLAAGLKVDRTNVRRLLAIRQKLNKYPSLSECFDKLVLIKLSHAE